MEQVDYLIARLMWAAVYVNTVSKVGGVNEQFACDAADRAIRAYNERFRKKDR